MTSQVETCSILYKLISNL